MSITEISCEVLRNKLLSEEDFFLVDVREPEEFETGFIPGAILIPLAELPEHLSDFSCDDTFVISCKMGGRSAEAALVMKEAGFKYISSLIGGVQRWDMQYGSSKELI